MSILSSSLSLILAVASCAGSAPPIETGGPPTGDTAGAEETGAPGDTAGGDTAGGAADLTGSWSFDGDAVDLWIEEGEGGLRTYTLTSTHPMRDGGPSARTFSEQAGDPLLRSGVLLTDALFAMAVEEARQNAISQISDGAFEAPVDCECYQTGELWSWVWTRDIAYAAELGLAWLDPDRAANSLLFKLSELKSGGGLQIVQDTGTGGSWPVSTDRVAWARGAMAVLRYRDHEALRAAAIEAMRNTAEIDRRYAYDPRDGLYRGETSFLDWRAQSYPAWTADDVGHIGMSKSLSTNLDHLFLLRSLESLTGEEHDADALAAAIEAAFWTDEGVYSSYLTTELDPAPVHRQDLLSTALAVIDLGTHPEALAVYPHGPAGPPVIWPQQQFTPIYHNRATWPFVTAYAVIAARAADNGAVFDAGLDALIRGAALNLSHMENFEVEVGANWLDDGDYSGPVINSRRQLWSVAGFLGAVAHGVFGVEGDLAAPGALSAAPVLPGGGWFEPGATLQIGDATFEIGADGLGDGAITWFDIDDWRGLYGAGGPTVALEGSGDDVTLTFSGDDGATFDVYRDGALAEAGASSPWRDVSPTTRCYAVVSWLTYASQPSAPQCWWGDGYARIQSVPASAFSAVGGAWSENHGRGHYEDWGEPGHTLSFTLTPERSGEHLLQLVFGNGAGGVDTGVTAAVKWVEITAGGALVAEGPIVMPHQGTWEEWADSSFLPATLQAGVAYAVTVRDGFNMSYLAHYEAYVGGVGGGSAPYNDVNVAEAKLLFMR